MASKVTPIEQLPNVHLETQKENYQQYQPSPEEYEHQITGQQNYQERQFVHPMPPPPQYEEPQPMYVPRQVRFQEQPEFIAEKRGIFSFIKENSKVILVLFVILFAVQLEGVQSMFRKMAGIIRIPEDYIFTGSKALSSLVGTIMFFVAQINL